MHSGPLPDVDFRPLDLPSLSSTAAVGAPTTPQQTRPRATRYVPAAYLGLTGLAWLLAAVMEVLGMAGLESWGIPVVELALATIALSAAIGSVRRWRLAAAFFSWLGLFGGGWAGVRVIASGAGYVPLLLLSCGLLVVGLVLWLRSRSGSVSTEAARPRFDGPNDAPYVTQPHTEQELLALGRDRLPPL